MADAGLVIEVGLLQEAFGHLLTVIQHDGAVHHEEGLGGDDGGVAVAVGGGGVGQIEGLKDFVERTAQDGDVSGANGAVVVYFAAFGGVGDVLAVFVSEDAAAHVEGEPAGGAHDAVTNFFAFEAAAVGAPEESIFRVDFGGVRVEAGAQSIDVRQHDLAVHGFD